MGQGVRGFAGESTTSAIVSCIRGFGERGAAPKRRGGEARREGAGLLAPPPRAAKGRRRGRSMLSSFDGLGLPAWPRLTRVGGRGSAQDGDVGQRTSGGCGGQWSGRDRGLQQRTRLLPPCAAAPRVPAAPAAGNAPVPALALAPVSHRRRRDTWSVAWGRAGRAFLGRGGRSGLSRRRGTGQAEGPSRAASAAPGVCGSPGLDDLSSFRRLPLGESGLSHNFIFYFRGQILLTPGWKALEKSFLLLLFVFLKMVSRPSSPGARPAVVRASRGAGLVCLPGPWATRPAPRVPAAGQVNGKKVLS